MAAAAASCSPKAASRQRRPTARAWSSPARRNQGASLLIWSQADGSVQTLVPEGRFADVAYPQFSPRSDQIAFVAPQSGLPIGWTAHASALDDAVRSVQVAYAHGIPWDPWVDQRRRHRPAPRRRDRRRRAVGRLVARQTQLFVYSGTGSFIVDAGGRRAVTPLGFVQGYGPVVWVGTEHVACSAWHNARDVHDADDRHNGLAAAPPREDQVRAVALRLFKEKGYHATSMRDIADEVGINKGSLYSYITSKEDLLIPVFERRHGRAARRRSRRSAPTPPCRRPSASGAPSTPTSRPSPTTWTC